MSIPTEHRSCRCGCGQTFEARPSHFKEFASRQCAARFNAKLLAGVPKHMLHQASAGTKRSHQRKTPTSAPR